MIDFVELYTFFKAYIIQILIFGWIGYESVKWARKKLTPATEEVTNDS